MPTNSAAAGPADSQLPVIKIPPPAPVDQSRMLAFREISSLKNADERILKYKVTREQVAQVDSGLDHWLASTLSGSSEHQDVITNDGALMPRPAPARPFLGPASAGQQQQQQSSTPNRAPSASYSPGGVSNQSGGKSSSKGKFSSASGIGGAAKGFFSKRRNILKGGDKVD